MFGLGRPLNDWFRHPHEGPPRTASLQLAGVLANDKDDGRVHSYGHASEAIRGWRKIHYARGESMKYSKNSNPYSKGKSLLRFTKFTYSNTPTATPARPSVGCIGCTCSFHPGGVGRVVSRCVIFE